MRWLAALGLACKPMLVAEVDVLVPWEVEERYSSGQPGRLVLHVDQPSLERTVALGLLCNAKGPKQGPDRYRYTAVDLGCAEPGRVEAWIVRHPADDPNVVCGASDAWLEEGDPGFQRGSPAMSPYAEAEVFGAADADDCRPGKQHVTLELEVPSGW